MTPTSRELVGLEAVSCDGERIGKIRDVVSDPQRVSEYLVITYSLFYDLVVPAGAAERRGAAVTIHLARRSLDVVLRVA